MIKIFSTITILSSLWVSAQQSPQTAIIDSIVRQIDYDKSVVIKSYDTVSFEKEDGGNSWDSSYRHQEFYYKNEQLVKAVAWTKYGSWRHDIISYYQNGKTIKFLKGESYGDELNSMSFDFAIYYRQDIEILVKWLKPKPKNVVGVATDIFLKWSYQLQQKAR